MAASDPDRPPLPEGLVTFLLTDMEGSTRMWERDPAAMQEAHDVHDRLVEELCAAYGGVRPAEQGEGDSALVAFTRAADAVACALDLQRRLLATPWPPSVPVAVRMALHTGEAFARDGQYRGMTVIRAARVRAAARGRQVLLSAATAELVEGKLPPGTSLKRLGLVRLAKIAAPETIYALVHPDLPDEFPPLDWATHNLPDPQTALVGRARELEQVAEALQGSRLVTLVGPGGAGKTRLAIEAARAALPEHDDGVWFVDLQSAARDDVVVTQVAKVLGLTPGPGGELDETLEDQLRGRQMLVVLDNCEQVLAGAADVASALLRVVPDVRVLATSREPLRVVSETLLEIPPLGVPDEREERPDELLRSDAVRLFVDRAARAKPGFALDDHNARAVATIARGLDGLPLAIELAAARSNSMTPAQIADRLGRRFDLLTTGPRDVGERHRTLRALVDWSYDLLSDREALAFRRLGVFHGGFTVEAAEAVCGGAPLDELDVLPLLGQLADRSLLVPDERYGQPRYRMLETIRGYAVAKLEESGEAPVLRARHVEWFRDRARRSYEELIGPRQRRWLDELEADMPNLRAVLEATAEGEGRDPDERLDPLVWLGRFWLIRGYIAEGMRWLDSALRQPYGESELVARAKHMYCNLAYMQGDAAAAQAAGWEAVEMARRLDHPEILVLALNSLGNISIRLREFDEARRLLTEALRIARERGEERNMTPVLGNLGLLEMYLGDDDAAEAFMRETLDLARQLDDRELVANQLNNLGVIAWNRDRVEESKALFEEGLAVAREIGAKNAMANFLVNLAEYAEDPDEAEILAGESLEAAQDLGERGVAAGALNALGRAAEAKGEMGRARGFYAEAIHEAERGRAIEWRAVATGNLAKLLLLEDAEAGEGYAREALILRKEIGDTGALGSLVIALVRAAQDAGAADAARRLMEEGLTICRSLDPEMADEVAAEIQAAVRTDRS